MAKRYGTSESIVVSNHASVYHDPRRYDSVVINGQLAWQDRLNSYNLPFFLSSSGLFSNYTVIPSSEYHLLPD